MAQENQEKELQGTDPAQAEKVFTQADVDRIINKRFAEVKSGSEEAAELRAELERLKQQENDRIQKQLEEQGEYKKIAETMKAQLAEAQQRAAKAEEYEQDMKAYVEETTAKIPDDLKSFVPDGTVRQQFVWLKTNSEKLMKPQAPPTGAGARGAGGSTTQIELSPEEQLIAKKFGMTDEEYFKYKEK